MFKNIKIITLLTLIITALAVTGCGTSDRSGPEPTAPVVVSVVDGIGTAIGDGATGVIPTQFVVTFSEAMDSCSIIDCPAASMNKASYNADNIRFSCSDGAVTPTVSVAADDTDTVFTFVIEDAEELALLTCSVSVGTGVQSADGVSLTEDVAVNNFTNACTVSDDFDVNSSSCWTVGDNSTPSSWSEALNNNILQFGSSLLFDATETVEFKNFGAFKEVSNTPTSVEMLIHINNFSDFMEMEGFGLGLSKDKDLLAIDKLLFLGVGYSHPNERVCFVTLFSGGQIIALKDCTGIDDIYIKLAADEESFVMSWSENGTDFREVWDSEEPGFPTTLPELLTDLGDDTLYLSLVFRGESDSGSIVSVDLTGFEVDGQYN